MVGHGGKLIKLAAWRMNTHSSVADGRMETLAGLGALRCRTGTDPADPGVCYSGSGAEVVGNSARASGKGNGSGSKTGMGTSDLCVPGSP